MDEKRRLIFSALIIAGLLVTMLPIITFLSQAQDGNTGNDTFSIVQISDTQFLSASYPRLFNDTINWIVANSETYNVKMVVHTGDIVDNINGTSGSSSDPNQWQSANNSMGILLNAGIPYSWDAGNHDQIPWNDANGTWLGSTYSVFNASTMRSKSYWASDFADSKNTAVRFSFKGYDFLIINIEYMASNATLTWMKTLLENNKVANVIIAAHSYLNKGGGYGFSSPGLPGEVQWCKNLRSIIDGYPKVFLTLSGHDPSGIANMTQIGSREEIFFDRQGVNNQTGAAAVRVYTFNTTSMSVNTSTYAYTLSTNMWTWLTDSYNQFNFNISLSKNDWTLATNARTLNGNPDLREFIWVKNATMPPNGPYDKVGLHRLIKTGVEPKGVIFMDPGIYGSGEQLISPADSTYSVDESSNQLVFWANRGFDVYSIDWRAHFLPLTINSTEASPYASNWGWTQYINDMKEAIDKAKEISGNSKIFLAGMSWGGAVSMYYASEYWKQDLRGLILIDGAENTQKSPTTTNTLNATLSINLANSSNSMAWENPRRSQTSVPIPGMIFCYKNALQNPGAPAEWPLGTPLQPTTNPLTNKPWTNITEYIAYQQYSTNFSNIYNGYGNITVMMQRSAAGDRYWPLRLGIESNGLHDWNNNPYISFDYDDHYSEINVPVLAIRTELYGIATYGNYINGLATTDYTQIILTKYGHLDAYVGPYSARDVSEPIYQWMLNHLLKSSLTAPTTSMHVGYSIPLTVSVAGGPAPYTYQWYEGNTIMQGATKPQIYVLKFTPGSYSFTCSVTDALGMTSNTTAMTFTVLPALPTQTPHTNPPTQTKTTSTPTPTQMTPTTPTTTPIQTVNPTDEPQTDNNNTTSYIVIAIAVVAIAALASAVIIAKKRKKK